ncbi:hypothetical protein PILCRDRAFT_823428 [Piloderma croceum F 1598]|uniref:Uncharacterized protein n=1 Tax=Piloderma croceum (strain F 1598) TaxID=765440 RepID=A0A0C3FIE7_PILCF|nr:hypothetical protein PILCRDRAFT_823428 [Piloderma croceum F 1598]
MVSSSPSTAMTNAEPSLLIRILNYSLVLGFLYKAESASCSHEKIRQASFLISPQEVTESTFVSQNENDDEEFCCNHRLCVAMSIGAILIAACVIPLLAISGFMNVASLAAIGSVAGTLTAWLQSIAYCGATCGMCYALQLFAITTVAASGGVIIVGGLAIGGGIMVVK